MPRFAFRITIAVLTFTIGLSSVWLNKLYPKFEDFLVEQLSSTPDLDSFHKFTPMMFVCGAKGSYHTYTSPDGQILSHNSELFDSPASAAKVLEKWASVAKRIVERTPVFDEKGKQVGERVVAVFSSSRTFIFGTYDSVLWSVDASSLEYALAFEKEHEHR